MALTPVRFIARKMPNGEVIRFPIYESGSKNPPISFSHVINSPITSLSKRDLPYARKLIKFGLDTLDENKSVIIKHQPEQYKQSLARYKQFELELTQLENRRALQQRRPAIPASAISYTGTEARELSQLQNYPKQTNVFLKQFTGKESTIGNDSKDEAMLGFINHFMDNRTSPPLDYSKHSTLKGQFNDTATIGKVISGIGERKDRYLEDIDKISKLEVERYDLANVRGQKDVVRLGEIQKQISYLNNRAEYDRLKLPQASMPPQSIIDKRNNINPVPEPRTKDTERKFIELGNKYREERQGIYAGTVTDGLTPIQEKLKYLKANKSLLDNTVHQINALKSNPASSKVDNTVNSERLQELREKAVALGKEQVRLSNLPLENFVRKMRDRLLDANKVKVDDARYKEVRAKSARENMTTPYKTTDITSRSALGYATKTPLQLLADRVKNKTDAEREASINTIYNFKQVNNSPTAFPVSTFSLTNQNKGIGKETNIGGAVYNSSGLCSNCGGTGNVSNGKTCKTCQGSGSPKQADFGKLSSSYYCRTCNSKGKINPNCKSCGGRTTLFTRGMILDSAGREHQRQVEKKDRRFAKIHKKRESDIVVRRPVVDDLGKPRYWFVSKIDGKPVDGIDKWTGFRVKSPKSAI